MKTRKIRNLSIILVSIMLGITSCNNAPAHEHSYSRYEHDANNHWQVCEECKEATEKVAHSGGTATCSHKAICSVCGAEYGELAPHQYGQLIEKVNATCEEEGVEAHYQCSECHKYFTEQKVETTLEALKIDSAGHNYGQLVAAVSPDCENGGHQAYYHCEICDKYFTEQKVETTLEALQLEALGHDYGSLIEQINATCEGSGVRAHYECSRCHKLFDEQKVEKTSAELVIGALGHTYGDLIEKVPATCTTDGVEAHYCCAECGKYFTADKVETTLEALKILAGHTYGDLVSAVEPDCENDGHVAYYHCEVCDKYFTEEKFETTLETLIISAHHSYGELVARVEATCEGEGLEAHYQCNVCNKYFDENKLETTFESLKIAPKGHTYGDLIAKVDPNCTSTGLLEHYHCSECGKYFNSNKEEVTLESLNIDALGHSYPNTWLPDLEDTSRHYHICDVCGEKEYANHVFDQEVVSDNTLIGVFEEACCASNKYYKSCVCGAISTSENDSFTVTNEPHNQELEAKEATSGDLLYLSGLTNNMNASKFFLATHNPDVANESSGFSYHIITTADANDWPNMILELSKPIDLTSSRISISAKSVGATKISLMPVDASGTNMLKWNMDTNNINNDWQMFTFAPTSNQYADGFDLTNVNRLKIVIDFNAHHGDIQQMWLDELHVTEIAYANGASGYNLEMCTYSAGQWRGYNSTPEIIFNDVYGSNSNSALKITFKDTNATLPGRVYASFDLAQTAAFGTGNAVDVKNSTLSFDIKLSQEFYDAANSQFTFKHEDSSWSGIEKWYNLDGYANGNPTTWLHISIDLSAKYGSETRNANTYAFTLGFFGMTAETVQTAWIIIDNLSIVANT